MSSQLQIEANRRNAQHSTGPRTPEGKAVSRFNALKTGLEAKSQIIPGEDSDQFETLSRDYYLEWQPATPTECVLVDDLVRADWQLRRLSRAEAQLWAHELADAAKSFNGLDEDAPLGHVVARSYHQFHFLQRRIDAAERALYRALAQLQRLRHGPPPPDPDPDPAPDPRPAASHPSPSHPVPQTTENPTSSGPIGFVPSSLAGAILEADYDRQEHAKRANQGEPAPGSVERGGVARLCGAAGWDGIGRRAGARTGHLQA